MDLKNPLHFLGEPEGPTPTLSLGSLVIYELPVSGLDKSPVKASDLSPVYTVQISDYYAVYSDLAIQGRRLRLEMYLELVRYIKSFSILVNANGVCLFKMLNENANSVQVQASCSSVQVILPHQLYIRSFDLFDWGVYFSVDASVNSFEPGLVKFNERGSVNSTKKFPVGIGPSPSVVAGPFFLLHLNKPGTDDLRQIIFDFAKSVKPEMFSMTNEIQIKPLRKDDILLKDAWLIPLKKSAVDPVTVRIQSEDWDPTDWLCLTVCGLADDGSSSYKSNFCFYNGMKYSQPAVDGDMIGPIRVPFPEQNGGQKSTTSCDMGIANLLGVGYVFGFGY